MTEREIIDQIEQDASYDEAFFSFRTTDADQDNEHIEANKDGLKLFATFLLRIAYNYNPKESEHQKNLFPIDNLFTLLDRGWIIYYVKLIDQKKSIVEKKSEVSKESLKDKLFKYGCFTIIGLAIIFCIIGLINSIAWIFT